MSEFRIQFITPLFSRGANEEVPEVRPASIRGQLHWWHRALGGSSKQEGEIYGSVHTKPAQSSKVVIRVSDIRGTKGELPTLPHKSGNMAGPRIAYVSGTSFRLHVIERLGGIPKNHRAHFERTLRAWLLIGSLGLRSTRAAGSFRVETDSTGLFSAPASFDDFARACADELQGTDIRFALLDEIYTSSEDLRKVVSDTLGGRDRPTENNDLSRLNDPLGRIHRGRKTSPLRFRAVQIQNQFRIAAIWDGRREVTGNSSANLAGIVTLLRDRKPALGEQLAASGIANHPG